MAAEPFIKVSWVRYDGSAHDTTFYGHAAESCALSFADGLEKAKTTIYVAAVQRFTNRFGGDVSWDVVREFVKPKEDRAHGA